MSNFGGNLRWHPSVPRTHGTPLSPCGFHMCTEPRCTWVKHRLPAGHNGVPQGTDGDQPWEPIWRHHRYASGTRMDPYVKEPMGQHRGFNLGKTVGTQWGSGGTIGGNLGAWGPSIVFHKGSP